MLSLDVTKKMYSYDNQSTKKGTLTTANRMLRDCQEDIRFCYDLRGKLYDKYDTCYAVPRR